jgi:hypothetical protein
LAYAQGNSEDIQADSNDLPCLSPRRSAKIAPAVGCRLSAQRGRCLSVALPELQRSFSRPADAPEPFVSRALPDLREPAAETHFIGLCELLERAALALSADTSVSLRTLPL